MKNNNRISFKYIDKIILEPDEEGRYILPDVVKVALNMKDDSELILEELEDGIKITKIPE